MMGEISRIFWDWNGVLGLKGFWNKSSRSEPEVAKFTEYVFDDTDRIKQWMKGDLSVDQLIYESKSRLNAVTLGDLLQRDWGEIGNINLALFSSIKALYPKAVHYIVTDNMDVFSTYAKTNSYLKTQFINVFNSCDERLLKESYPGLFEHVRDSLGLLSFNGCLLLDDSLANCRHFEKLGGRAVLVTRNS